MPIANRFQASGFLGGYLAAGEVQRERQKHAQQTRQRDLDIMQKTEELEEKRATREGRVARQKEEDLLGAEEAAAEREMLPEKKKLAKRKMKKQQVDITREMDDAILEDYVDLEQSATPQNYAQMLEAVRQRNGMTAEEFDEWRKVSGLTGDYMQDRAARKRLSGRAIHNLETRRKEHLAAYKAELESELAAAKSAAKGVKAEKFNIGEGAYPNLAEAEYNLMQIIADRTTDPQTRAWAVQKLQHVQTLQGDLLAKEGVGAEDKVFTQAREWMLADDDFSNDLNMAQDEDLAVEVDMRSVERAKEALMQYTKEDPDTALLRFRREWVYSPFAPGKEAGYLWGDGYKAVPGQWRRRVAEEAELETWRALGSNLDESSVMEQADYLRDLEGFKAL